MFRYVDDGERFRSLMARLEGSPELVVLVSKDNANHPAELARYTTRGMLRVEERMAEIAFEMAAADRHRVRDAAFRSALSEHPQLSHEQREAFRQTISARDIEAVAGFAGSGKSAAVAAAKDAWEASGYRVRGGALSGIAAENLEKSSGLERSGRAMANRASHDADVSIALPKMPYGGFSPVRLQGRLSVGAFPK